MCVRRLFCMKFNSEQLLCEQVFDIIGNFCSNQPEIESTFLFQYNIIFGIYQSFEPRHFSGGEENMVTNRADLPIKVTFSV